MKNKKNLIVIITTKGLNQNLKKVYQSLIINSGSYDLSVLQTNLKLNDQSANIIDLTERNQKRGTAFAGGGDDKGGVDGIPIIDSSNKNDDQILVAKSLMNLNLK